MIWSAQLKPFLIFKFFKFDIFVQSFEGNNGFISSYDGES